MPQLNKISKEKYHMVQNSRMNEIINVKKKSFVIVLQRLKYLFALVLILRAMLRGRTELATK
jgi:hypothetical protein